MSSSDQSGSAKPVDLTPIINQRRIERMERAALDAALERDADARLAKMPAAVEAAECMHTLLANVHDSQFLAFFYRASGDELARLAEQDIYDVSNEEQELLCAKQWAKACAAEQPAAVIAALRNVPPELMARGLVHFVKHTEKDLPKAIRFQAAYNRAVADRLDELVAAAKSTAANRT